MTNKVLPPTFRRTDERGRFIEIINDGRWETLICGEMHAGVVMGNHYHRKTEVFFFLKTGSARIDIVHVETGERRCLSLGTEQGLVLEANESHAIRFLKDSEFIILKSLRYDPDDPDTFPFPVETLA